MYDIYASFDFGYDPDTVEEGPIARLTPPATLPKQATVNPAWLPPVGHQHTPSCFVWASVYGLATYNAAKAGNYSPRTAAQQASPYYAYVKVLEGQNVSSDICQGGKMVWCFSLLNQEDGTPSMQQAPEPVVAAGSNACLAVWSDYGSAELPSDQVFAVSSYGQIDLKGEDWLEQLKTAIVQNTPLAYGTSLYTDFPGYGRTPDSGIAWPIPYVGNGTVLMNGSKKAGHCMMIIGYDDDMQAVLIQNSFGTEWGIQWNGGYGYIWMAYETFRKLAQGAAFVISGS